MICKIVHPHCIRSCSKGPTLALVLGLALSGAALGKQVSFAGYSAEKASRSVATYYSDVVISGKIKSTLKREMDVAVEGVKVDTYSGVVRLSGTTTDPAAMQRIVELAWSIKGVKKVVPDLVVLMTNNQ